MSARQMAVANENRSIEQSQQRAVAAREAESRPRNALEAMARRLDVSPAGLKDTLTNTVFSGCRSEAEFIALVIVANEYGLNPLTKEIYAFPAKGGGIVPMVSVDGWIRIMNSHPQFDGIEFEDIVDQQGKVQAIEGVIYRKDRARPTKVIEYLDECRRGTEPWKMMPNRMLRNRTLIQTARIAFGFSGIVAEGDDVIDIEPTRSSESVPALPSRQSLDERPLGEVIGDEVPNFDKDTGEVVEQQRDSRGMSEVDEETARALDNPEPETEEPEEAEVEEEPTWKQYADEVEQLAANAKTPADIKKAEKRLEQVYAGIPEQQAESLTRMVAKRRAAIAEQGK